MLGTDLELSQFVGQRLNLEGNPGKPCSHIGCLNHVTHPCEGCGRITGVSYPNYAADMNWATVLIKAMQSIKYECQINFFFGGLNRIPLVSVAFTEYEQTKRYCGTSEHPPSAILQAAVEALEDLELQQETK